MIINKIIIIIIIIIYIFLNTKITLFIDSKKIDFLQIQEYEYYYIIIIIIITIIIKPFIDNKANYIIPLAPVLANLFMGHHENIWLDQYGDSEVLFYRRYVDDTFCLFHSERDATLFFNYINNQHPNIPFTMERETDHVLPFLDVLINNTDPHQSVTTVYRKKTFTGLLTSYLSFCPFTYKLG